ncbi:MAG: substrate-binding domain-containing protein [Candidatus Eisenbacteria bacterium]
MRPSLIAASFVLTVLLASPIRADADPIPADDNLFVYCCAGFRPPIEAAAQAFSAETGVKIDLTYAGSGCLIAQAELAGRGDLFLPGEEHYITKAQERGIVGTISQVAYLRPVIAVRKGNPLDIHVLADLARPGLRVGLGDPKSVAVGVASESWFRASLTDVQISKILKNTTTRAINVNELGNQLALGGIDAAIVWDVTVPLFDGLEAIVTPDSRAHRTVITGGVLQMSKRPELAARFLSFLTESEGREILRSFGYEPYEAEVAAASDAAPATGPEVAEQSAAAASERDIDGQPEAHP